MMLSKLHLQENEVEQQQVTQTEKNSVFHDICYRSLHGFQVTDR